MSGEPRSQSNRTKLAERLADAKQRRPGRMLNFLRQNAQYLTPGRGLNLFSLLWIALRGALMGLLVYISLLSLLFIAAYGGFVILNSIGGRIGHPLPGTPGQWCLGLAAVGFGLCGLSIPFYSLGTYLFQGQVSWAPYLMRRGYECVAGRVLPGLLVLALLGIMPSAHHWLIKQGESPHAKAGHFEITGQRTAGDKLSFTGTVTPLPETAPPTRPNPNAGTQPSASDSPLAKLFAPFRQEIHAFLAGLLTILIGFGSSLLAFLKTKSVKPGKLPLGLLVSLGVATLLFGVVLFAYTIAHAFINIPGMGKWLLFVAGLLLMPLLAIVTNINHLSIHRYYRDRLMETFMPNVQDVLDGLYERTHWSKTANMTPLHEMKKGPYHIINTNVVLVSSNHPKFRVRGGDNFILSPAYCGSNATGWRQTNTYMQGAMTLASAMAISGAALNPSAGCGGEGLTRSTFLSVLMGLLNFRLGYWTPNPKNPTMATFGRRTPNFLLPGLWEVLWRNRLNENGVFVQLSDGGHFENLALYELVRRKLRYIIVCDGGADPKFTFSDLANAMEKVRTDFGALIMIDNGDLQALTPQPGKDGDSVRCARQGHLVAKIKYADNSDGTLIFLTTTFFEGLSADLYGYKKEHPSFPDESTGDQFFDEKQFEAYRELGFQAAWKMTGDDKASWRA